jgi:TolB protein
MCGLLTCLALVAGTIVPHSGELVFTSTRAGNLDIFLMDVSRVLSVNLTRSHINECCPAWSPDGKRIAFISWLDEGNEVSVVDVNGHRLPDTLNETAQNSTLIASLSPGRRWIAYTAVRDGNTEIFVVDTRGRTPRRLTWNDADDFSPRWRPGSG